MSENVDAVLDADRWKKLAGLEAVPPDPEELQEAAVIAAVSGHAWEIIISSMLSGTAVVEITQPQTVHLITPGRDFASVAVTLAAKHCEYMLASLKEIRYLGAVSGRAAIADRELLKKLQQADEISQDGGTIFKNLQRVVLTNMPQLSELRKSCDTAAKSHVGVLDPVLEQDPFAVAARLNAAASQQEAFRREVDGRPESYETAIQAGALIGSVPSTQLTNIKLSEADSTNGVA